MLLFVLFIGNGHAYTTSVGVHVGDQFEFTLNSYYEDTQINYTKSLFYNLSIAEGDMFTISVNQISTNEALNKTAYLSFSSNGMKVSYMDNMTDKTGFVLYTIWDTWGNETDDGWVRDVNQTDSQFALTLRHYGHLGDIGYIINQQTIFEKTTGMVWASDYLVINGLDDSTILSWGFRRVSKDTTKTTPQSIIPVTYPFFALILASYIYKEQRKKIILNN